MTLNRIKSAVNIGDPVWMPEEHLAIEHDMVYADGLTFTVAKKYPHVVLLERQTPKGVHRQCVSYASLALFGKVKGVIYGKGKT